MTKEYLTKWTVISFLIGTIFGTGSIWKYFDYKLQQEKLRSEQAETATKLRSQLEPLLREIIALTDEYLMVQKEGNIPEVHNRLTAIKARLAILKDNANSLETKSAFLEHREEKKINLNFFPPSAPTLH